MPKIVLEEVAKKLYLVKVVTSTVIWHKFKKYIEAGLSMEGSMACFFSLVTLLLNFYFWGTGHYVMPTFNFEIFLKFPNFL